METCPKEGWESHWPHFASLEQRSRCPRTQQYVSEQSRHYYAHITEQNPTAL